MPDDEQRPNAEGPEATEEEQEQAGTSRHEEEDAMRYPTHENPDIPRDEQIYDE